MSTESYVNLNYKLASGAILSQGGYKDETGYEIEFYNSYFFNEWCEKNLEPVPNHLDEYWLPFEKVDEIIEKINKIAVFSHSKDTSEIIKVFPHINDMKEYYLKNSGITRTKSGYAYDYRFFEELGKITNKLANILAYKGNPDIIFSYTICK